MHEEFVYTMLIKHVCGNEVTVQGTEWPPQVVVCTACDEIMGLSQDRGEKEARFKKIGTLKIGKPQ